MSLLCKLGRHRALPVARWNQGYYFSRCSRCGTDLVRATYGGWFVPKGYRVVWKVRPPEPESPAELIEAPPAPARRSWRTWLQPRRSSETLPAKLRASAAPSAPLAIEEVLRHLGESEPPAPEAAQPPAPPPPPPPRARPAREALAEFESWAHNVGERPAAQSQRHQDAQRSAGTAEAETPPRRASLVAPVLVLLLIALVALAIVAWTLGIDIGRTPTEAAPPPVAAATPPPAVAQRPQPAFVAVRLLNCRSAPDPAAETVRRLSLGATLGIVARQAGWLRVVHLREQCWVQERFVSLEAPE